MIKNFKLIFIIGGAILAIIALIGGMKIYDYTSLKNRVSNFEGYYGELAKQCVENYKEGPNCCLGSVDAIRKGGYKLSQDGTCDDGFRVEMFKCIGSYKWCEPEAKP